jgi:hypothetical protein
MSTSNSAVFYYILNPAPLSLFTSMEWHDVSELRPPKGVLLIFQWYVSMDCHGGIILTEENRRTRRKIGPTVTLITTNSTSTEPGAIPSLRGERPAINRLSHGKAYPVSLLASNKFCIFCIYILSSEISPLVSASSWSVLFISNQSLRFWTSGINSLTSLFSDTF